MQCLRFDGQIAMSNPGISKIEFAADSPLEGDGFEPSVPAAKEPVSVRARRCGQAARHRRAEGRVLIGRSALAPDKPTARYKDRLALAGQVRRRIPHPFNLPLESSDISAWSGRIAQLRRFNLFREGASCFERRSASCNCPHFRPALAGAAEPDRILDRRTRRDRTCHPPGVWARLPPTAHRLSI
jgi:hypothetical protein